MNCILPPDTQEPSLITLSTFLGVGGGGVQQLTISSLLPPCGQAVGCPQVPFSLQAAKGIDGGVHRRVPQSPQSPSPCPPLLFALRKEGQASPVGKVS